MSIQEPCAVLRKTPRGQHQSEKGPCTGGLTMPTPNESTRVWTTVGAGLPMSAHAPALAGVQDPSEATGMICIVVQHQAIVVPRKSKDFENAMR